MLGNILININRYKNVIFYLRKINNSLSFPTSLTIVNISAINETFQNMSRKRKSLTTMLIVF